MDRGGIESWTALEYSAVVPPTPVPRICYGCNERLSQASNAIRHHAALMDDAICLVQSGPTEEQLKEFRQRLVVSFNDAQEAWDDYREHLDGHGLLHDLLSSREVA
jgi:hypothetical protein